ncbi:MAG: efflux RND transporter periplasmic adaptor subunit [Acidobacteria bacterium]|nr:efflux RND transporter periplasmic adaptor subunit [Acidobacteriota bacterium]
MMKVVDPGRNLLLYVGLMALLALAVGCGRAPVAAQPASNSEAAVQVNVFRVQAAPMASSALIPSVLSVERTVAVLAQREGLLKTLRGEEGARVAQGEVLAQLDDAELRTQIREAELEVSRLRIEERQFESQVDVCRLELDQEQALFKDGLTAKRQLDRARYKLEGAQQELEKSRLATRGMQTKVEGLRLELAKAVIRAPFAGLVIHRFAKLGALAAKNEKLFEVAQLSPLEVKFQLPLSQAKDLSAGSTVTLLAADGVQSLAQARIRRLAPTADAASNTLGFTADVIEDAGLLPGMSVYVKLVADAALPGVWVPRAAFLDEAALTANGTAEVWVIEGGKCAQRTVSIGAADGDQVRVETGLTAGERLIIAPPLGLKAGAPVREK